MSVIISGINGSLNLFFYYFSVFVFPLIILFFVICYVIESYLGWFWRQITDAFSEEAKKEQSVKEQKGYYL